MKIKNFEPLKLFLKEKFPELVITQEHENSINAVESDGFNLYNYLDGLEVPRDDPIIRLCRGIVIREDGILMSLAFTRFFNYHEKECDVVDIENADIVEKFDGTLISVWHDGTNWRVTTRGAFPPALQGIDYGKEFRRLFKRFDLLCKGYTYAFELISKENRIVTKYDEEFVALIGMTVLETMQEANQKALDLLAGCMSVRRPRTYKATDIDSCRALFEQMRDDEEGLVVVDQNGKRFKLKQESYLKMARIMSLKDQDVLDYVMGKAEIDADFDKMPEVKERIKTVEKMYKDYDKLFMKAYEHIKGIESQKDFALKALKYPFSGPMFQFRKGLELKDIPLKYKSLEIWLKPKGL